jgi:hypothetical protein
MIDFDEYAYFLVITESGINPATWDQPFLPGNGETVFNRAMRLMVTGESGVAFTIHPGEVLVFENDFTLDPSWKADNCEVTAFIQQIESRRILQAESLFIAGILETPPQTGATCDFNKDGDIDISDVIALVLFQQSNPGDLQGDFNQDGTADIVDAIAMLLAQRDNTCP